MLAVLRHRDFRLLWVGQLVSSVGDRVTVVAIAVLVLDRYGSAGELGLVLGATSLSLVAFLLVGGVVADRFPRRSVMLGADALRAVCVATIALLPEAAPLGLVIALSLAFGAGEALFRPAYGALVPTVVPDEERPAANALTAVSLQSASVAGPALAGLLVALTGSRTALLVDAATYLVSMATLLRLREPPAEEVGTATSPLADALQGIRAVVERPFVLGVILMATVQLLVSVAPFQVLLPVIARERLGGDGSYAIVLALLAVGGLPGALLGARWSPPRQGIVALAALLPWGALLLALATSSSLVVIGAAATTAGFGLELFTLYWVTALQREVPRALLARVVALDWLGSLALLPVGLALAGPVAEAVGSGPLLVTGAVVWVLAIAAAALVPGAAEFRVPDRRPVAL